MIHPAPTARISPTLARGVLAEAHAATATRPAYIVLTVPNTSYQIHLLPTVPPQQLSAGVGKRIVGTIRIQARRVDIVDTGGRYIEPVFGHPRRVQGTVIDNPDAGRDSREILVDAGIPMHCTLTDPRQSPEQFSPGDLVSFDALDGATFTPAG